MKENWFQVSKYNVSTMPVATMTEITEFCPKISLSSSLLSDCWQARHHCGSQITAALGLLGLRSIPQNPGKTDAATLLDSMKSILPVLPLVTALVVINICT